MKNGLLNHEAVRYEVALGVVGAVIARCAQQIGDEMRKPQPDADKLRILEERQRELEASRTGLDPYDRPGIERLIAEYAPLARQRPQAGE